MKLILKDYAPYLASGLKVSLWNSDKVEALNIHRIPTALESNFKPYFRPLSSLYKALKDGSVPIVQLAKIVDDYGLSDEDWVVEKHSDVFVEVAGKETMPIQKFKVFFHPYFEIEYYEVPECGRRIERGITTEQYLEFFDYLYSNHFWLGDQSYFEKGIILNIEETEE